MSCSLVPVQILLLVEDHCWACLVCSSYGLRQDLVVQDTPHIRLGRQAKLVHFCQNGCTQALTLHEFLGISKDICILL